MSAGESAANSFLMLAMIRVLQEESHDFGGHSCYPARGCCNILPEPKADSYVCLDVRRMSLWVLLHAGRYVLLQGCIHSLAMQDLAMAIRPVSYKEKCQTRQQCASKLAWASPASGREQGCR